MFRNAYSASEALNVNLNGYTDWYLPSRDELSEMYNTIGNGGSHGNLGGFRESWYWSSSEYNDTDAWSVDFAYGNSSSSNRKEYPYYVRVIRSF